MIKLNHKACSEVLINLLDARHVVLLHRVPRSLGSLEVFDAGLLGQLALGARLLLLELVVVPLLRVGSRPNDLGVLGLDLLRLVAIAHQVIYHLVILFLVFVLLRSLLLLDGSSIICLSPLRTSRLALANLLDQQAAHASASFCCNKDTDGCCTYWR